MSASVLLRGVAADGAARVERSETRAAAAAQAPRAVTRGESVRSAPKAKCDWLNATFQQPERYSVPQFIALLSRVFRRPVTGVEGRGLFGFDRGVKLIAGAGSRTFPIGTLAYGGESQRGRWMLQLTGAGCAVVSSWSRLASLLGGLDARITRLDLCVDFLEGDYTVDDAVRMHLDGEFTCGGRRPSSSTAGDWIDGVKGRTFYVGNAANGKMLRVYEKGKQLGNLESPWVRFEVQLGNRDRVIPLRALTERDSFLAGCYPALEKMLAVAAQQIETTQTSGVATLGHLMFHLKRSYGKLIDAVSGGIGADHSELIESITVTGLPRRLAPASLSCGLSWDQLLSQLKRRQS